jgi:hypothetical protein
MLILGGKRHMDNRYTARKVKAKELGPELRRRLHLVADEEVSITITRETAKKARRREDPWREIRGTLSSAEADEMLQAIHESRGSKSEAPELGSP